MKHTLLIVALLALNLCGAQDIARDTLRLNGVLVGKNHKPKIKKQQIGGCTHYGTLDHPQEIITLIEKLPKGSLYSVTFSFNNAFRDKKKAKFDDTELEVVFYEMQADGTPGKLIASKQLTISENHRGSLEIDITDLNIQNQGAFFAGLKKITIPTSPVPHFEVHCLCSRNDNYKSYGRFYVKGMPEKWIKITVPAAIKMTVKTDAQ